MKGEDDWVCIVCLGVISSEDMKDAVQVELLVHGGQAIYFMRHGCCEMNDAARQRLALAGRGQKEPYR